MAATDPPARRRFRPRALAAGAVTALGALALVVGVTVLGGWPATLVLVGAGLVVTGLAGIDVDGE